MFKGLFGSLKTAAEGFANEAAKNMKICPACETPAGADQVFCPSCGAKLPEQTVAEGALCPSCGKQNSVGQKFCDSCGAKLPAALAQEQAIREKNAAVLAQWDSLLPQYPKWSFGGELSLEKTYTDECGNPCYSLGVDMASREMLEQYGQLLMQSGFRTAGRYPTADALYKKVGAVCYCCSWEHAFDAGEDCLTVDFLIREPSGGFDYVKPEPRAKTAGLAGEIAGGLLGRFKR